MLGGLSTSLKDTISKVRNSLFVDDKLIQEVIKELQKSLIKSDVNINLIFELTNTIKQRAKKEKPTGKLTKKDQLITILYEELSKFIGEGQTNSSVENKPKQKKPYKIQLVGLYGAGKTTTIGKLAKHYKKRGYKVATLSTDTWRPAAAEQLASLSKEVKVDYYIDTSLKNPVKIYQKYSKELEKYDVALIDTAGRDSLSEDLQVEIENINNAVKPDETILTLSADIGQASQKLAETFQEKLNITGIIITKLDGSAKGGGALAACKATGAPVLFIGTGEKVDDFEEFKPKRFVSRMLGMGDLETLLEKSKEVISEEDAEDLGKKFLKGDFNFLDLHQQMQTMNKMGSFSKILEMIPGMNNIPKGMLEGQQDKLKKWKFIMQSMTKQELEEPTTLNSSRIKRISAGSGTSTREVRDLYKQYKQSKKMMKMMKPGASEKDVQKMMKRMQSDPRSFK